MGRLRLKVKGCLCQGGGLWEVSGMMVREQGEGYRTLQERFFFFRLQWSAFALTMEDPSPTVKELKPLLKGQMLRHSAHKQLHK